MNKILARAAAISFLVLSPFLIAAEKKTLSVEECVDLGLKSSKFVRSSEARVEEAEAKSRQADATRLPSLSFSGGYTRLSEVPPFEVSLPFSIPGAPNAFVVSQNYFNNYALRVSLQQPLFTGFRLESGSKMAKFSSAASEYDLTKDRTELRFAIRSAYWNLYKAREFRRVIDENVELVKAHLGDVKNLFDQGLLTKNEVLRTQVQQSQVVLAQIDAANSVEMAAVVLNNLIGLPLETEIDLSTKVDETALFAEVEKLVGGGDEGGGKMLEKALATRPELRAMELRVQASDSGVTLAKSGWYPQISFVGNYYDLRPNSRLLPAQDKFYSTWDLSLNLSMSLWNWGATKSQTVQAEAQRTQAREALGQMKDGVAVEVRQSLLRLKSAREEIPVSREAVAQAEENLRVTEERFKEGIALNADVLDAEIALLRARTTLTQSLIDLEIARASLAKAIGD